jgi:small subunit ribosomal protein S20
MPITKTAKRALRVSKRKTTDNAQFTSVFEITLRKARKSKSKKDIAEANSLADRMAKKNLIHKNKASRIKSSLSKLAK